MENLWKYGLTAENVVEEMANHRCRIQAHGIIISYTSNITSLNDSFDVKKRNIKRSLQPGLGVLDVLSPSNKLILPCDLLPVHYI
ncbi:hypothetical protein FRX31_034214 [Thalictrum thalictroides]|uniref:Uncharacterized protein n=1 Tax=Thalictrum thalictroides TaxID=46969 RepID=A0A7J6UVE0_THATH|nr:hypothetical protein FRX31_034214 [Thalictrum thalictroides]